MSASWYHPNGHIAPGPRPAYSLSRGPESGAGPALAAAHAHPPTDPAAAPSGYRHNLPSTSSSPSPGSIHNSTTPRSAASTPTSQQHGFPAASAPVYHSAPYGQRAESDDDDDDGDDDDDDDEHHGMPKDAEPAPQPKKQPRRSQPAAKGRKSAPTTNAAAATATATAASSSSTGPQSAPAAPSAAASAPASSRKRKRVSRACDQCWMRKDRCDGGSPSCSICTRLSRTCTYTRPEKKRGPQQGVRGRLEAQCAALECVLGWILHCAEQEAGSSSTSSSASSSSSATQDRSSLVRPGTTLRLLLQPSAVAASALWSPNLAFPPTSSSLAGLARHWRSSVLATYLTSPLAPSSPGLAIGLEGATSIADGLDPDLAARQASGETGVLGQADESDIEPPKRIEVERPRTAEAPTPPEPEPRGSKSSKAPGKTRRVLGPAPEPRKPAPNPAAAHPPVSRGPPSPRTVPEDAYGGSMDHLSSPDGSASPHANASSGAPYKLGADVWARPVTQPSSGSAPPLPQREQNLADEAPPFREHPQAATQTSAQTQHKSHDSLQWFRTIMDTPDVAESNEQPGHASEGNLQAMRAAWAAMPQAALKPGGNPPTSNNPAATDAAAPNAANFATALDLNSSSSSRDSFDFTDPGAQALLYALGMGAASMVGVQPPPAQGAQPGPAMAHNAPAQPWSYQTPTPPTQPGAPNGYNTDPHTSAASSSPATAANWNTLSLAASGLLSQLQGTLQHPQLAFYAQPHQRSQTEPAHTHTGSPALVAPSANFHTAMTDGALGGHPAPNGASGGPQHARLDSSQLSTASSTVNTAILYQLGLQPDAFATGFKFPFDSWVGTFGASSRDDGAGTAADEDRATPAPGSSGSRLSAVPTASLSPTSTQAAGGSSVPAARRTIPPYVPITHTPTGSASVRTDAPSHAPLQAQAQTQTQTQTQAGPPDVSGTLRQHQQQAAELIRRDAFARPAR